MAIEHIPSCPVSRKWRGEKADHVVWANADTDVKLLEENGFVTRRGITWNGQLTQAEAEVLLPTVKCLSYNCECICYDPTLSGKGNEESRRVQTRKELAEGWAPGYKEPGLEKQELEETPNAGWQHRLWALLGLGPKKKEPEPDPTLDPNWEPEYC